MKVQIVTTITTLVDVETLNTDHSVQINAEQGVPEVFATAAVVGALKSALLTIDDKETNDD